MRSRLEKISLFVITMIFLMSILFFGLGYSTNQLSFILDPSNPIFTYEEDQFNDGTSFKLLHYTGNENQTVYVSIPKNSTITFSNISLRGESTPTQTYATDEVFSIAIGNAIVSTSENEIAVGAYGGINLLDSDGNELWSSLAGINVYGVDIGNVTADEGDEVAAATDDNIAHILRATDGSRVWNFTSTNNFNDVAIGNVITSTSENEVALACDDKKIYLLDNEGNELWSYSGDNSINGVAIGDVTTDEGNEVVAGANDRKLYLLNSSGNLIWGRDFVTANILDVAVGDINTSIPGEEIAAAADDNKVYILDANNNILWSYETGNDVEAVAIDDVTAGGGDEVVIGSRDKKVYLLNSAGELILRYSTDNTVQGVDIGDITADPGNEVVAGSRDSNVYILNFEYYPTNVYLDIGGDGDKDWQHSLSKLREFVNVSGPSINSEIQSYLDNDCISQVCDIPLVFHSDSGGDLNVMSINITYDYYASEAIFSKGPVVAWSRTNNTEVNESIGNQAMTIAYATPANDIEIKYITVDIGASLCDFVGKQYSVVNGLCNLSADIFNVNIGGLPPTSLLWDSSMTSGMPILGKEDAPITTLDGTWKKNFTVWNETQTIPATFYNVTASISIGEEVTSNEGLFVEWYGNIYDITPSIDCPDYENKTIIGDEFYTCKQDIEPDGVVNFFKVKQPHTSTTTYTVSGSLNFPSVLNNFVVTPPSDVWGKNFSFYVNVTDNEGDNVTVNLWVYHVNSGIWERIASQNTTTNTSVPETLIFDVTSSKSWIGQNYYTYEYQDFSGNKYLHPTQNITPPLTGGPDVLKHNVSILLIEGNDTSVTRQGSDSTTFTVVVTDTNWNQNVSDGVNCNFWVTKNKIDFESAYPTATNSSGFCNFDFDPNESYSLGQQWWKAGVYQDAYYNDNNSTDFIVNIYGEMGINLTIIGQNFTRNEDSILTAKLVDENLYNIYESGYTCTWYINNQPTGSSVTDHTGHCNHTWSTDCSSYLGSYLINVTLSDGGSSYYTITNNESSTNVFLIGTLNVTILLPVNNSIVYERQKVALNSTVIDECLTQDSYSHDVTWYSGYPFEHPDLCPNPPDGGAVAQGINTTWTLSWTCTPRYPQIISPKSTGDLYNPDKEWVSIYIFGFADVEITTPVDDDALWRNESSGIADIACRVTSNASGWGQSNYPVNFWESYEANPFNPINDVNSGMNTAYTNISGYANIKWNISSNSTVPEGNHTIKCNISDEPSLYFNTSITEDYITVMVLGPEDWLPPIIQRVSVNSVEQYKENVTIEADVYDIWGVDKVWVRIDNPDGTNSTHLMTQISSLTWRYSENFTSLGDYDFTIFANDTAGNENQASSWFEVYLPLILTGTITDWDGNNNITTQLNFYRDGTNYLIHQAETNSSYGFYNLTIHKRLYDLEVSVFNHTILFHGFNTTATAERQFNTTEITNITNPLNFTEIDITWIRPARYITKLNAFDVNSILINNITTLTMDYSSAADRIEYEPAVRISRCPSWSHGETTCAGWNDPAGTPDLESDTVSLDVSSLSVYAAIEAAECGDGYCHAGESCGEVYYCPDDCGKCPTGEPGGPGGGPSGGPSGRETVCGNGICETGENSQNCPEDCGPPETLFSVRTNLTEPQLNLGVEEIYALWIANNANYPINVSISVTGSIDKFISFEKDSVEIGAKKEEINKIYVIIPSNANTGTYTGDIYVTGDGKTVTLPITLTVSIKGAAELDVLVESRNKRVGINEKARFYVKLYNLGVWRMLDLNLTYYIEDPETQKVFYEESEKIQITQTKTLDKRVSLSELNISTGRYLFNATVQYDSKVVSAYDDFEITESFWTTDRIYQLILISVAIATPIIGYFAWKRYKTWKLSKARYIFPLDYDKLPRGEIWLGKIAETDRKAYFNMDELRTHVLTAGATGSGKSVSAMIFVEELLKEKIPVIVFDPTAQWSGFVRPCKDPNLLKFYKEFGMDKREVKPYRGMIYEVTDPNVKINFDKYMNPGEITVFMLNKLKPGQYDIAVGNIIDTIFAHGWEESTKLKMVVVFDEVHRLLEKYGGKGGYVALEKACREFRKWGIGLIMASQVLSDFKEAIKGNVLTEIQLHTKSLGDLGRVEKKYGIDYAKRVTKLEVGVGMMQNPRYNKGRPWFVAFRPTWHEPHKIPDRDLETYKEYAAILAKIEAKIVSMEKAGQDVFDLKTEFNLAQDKLKKGRFRMAKIYIDSLKKHVLEG